MVMGTYVKSFADASHVVFEGHLDDPGFRAIAIQRIKGLSPKTVTCERSGDLRIINGKRGQRVELSYMGTYAQMFGGKPTKTKGHPFKDDRTDAVGLFASNTTTGEGAS